MAGTHQRIDLLDDLNLTSGSHKSFDDGVSLLEAVAWIAGEPFSDHPACVCPVIATFGRSWNDSLPDDETRNRLLRPLIPELIGTASTPDVEDARAFMAADWLVRVFMPAWLRLAGLEENAAELEGLKGLATGPLCEEAMPAITRARDAAWDAAGDSAWDAARVAAWDAARVAAREAARDAAQAAAWTAAWDAAWDAARVAARVAAWDAAQAAAQAAAWTAAWDAASPLGPTVAILQTSAVDLFERMCEVAA